MRKCKKVVENIFFVTFSRMQTNTLKKYSTKHFQKCNQIL